MNGRGKGASKGAPLDKESQWNALSVREHGAGASQARLQEDADSQLGFTMLAQGEQRTGWLLNVATVRAHSAPIAWSEPSAATIRCSLPAHLSAVLRQRRNLRPRAHRSLSFLSRPGQPTFRSSSEPPCGSVFHSGLYDLCARRTAPSSAPTSPIAPTSTSPPRLALPLHCWNPSA